jgi:hypothetical protein
VEKTEIIASGSKCKSDKKRFSHDTFDVIVPPFWSLLAITDENKAILYIICA